ncbi:MAG: anaerobic ribonucleoside-triphosphate reductase activating protein [Clostridia bacterium]|nr:anaerobic ribonucleoside-triphosphate reductase activating protein [Clostridia bacterium]
MKIGGFQKMTMLDFPERVACTVFTYGCNLRCPFCHNATLVIDKAELFDEDEILAYINKRKGVLDGVCITGGEPLLQRDIFDFMKKIKDLGLLVKLDTNGAYPDLLKRAIDEGLVDYVAMDIKNSREKYALTAGIEDLDISPFEKSVEILKTSGIDYELRTTVVRELHELSDMKKIAEWISGAKKYFLQSFVDSGNTIKTGYSAHDKNTLEAFRQAVLEHIPSAEIRGI